MVKKDLHDKIKQAQDMNAWLLEESKSRTSSEHSAPIGTGLKNPSMGTIVKKETYTTENPDGTIVTTVTTTKESQGYGFGAPGTFYAGYFATPIGILRILEIIFGFIIIGCAAGQFNSAGPFHGILSGNTYTITMACVCIVTTFCLFVLFVLALNTTLFQHVPWRTFDLVYCVIAVVLHLVGGCIEAWLASGIWRQNCNQFMLGQYENCPTLPALAAASAFCFLNAILYLLSAYFATKEKYYIVEP